MDKSHQIRKPFRTEPKLQISEFHLVKGDVHVKELTKSLKNKKSRVKISDSVQKTSKNSYTLPKPLEKPQADRIRRGVAYEKARLELDRWESVITANRVSTDLTFPLDDDINLEKKEANSFTNMWRVKSKLEEELEKIDPKVEEHYIHLEQEKFPLTMKEMLARRKEAAKLRAFQGYKEAKARRQNKIKSKKYHRILKREKIKQKLKEFEQLQKTDPELALKKLEEIEKSRVEERFSLRHKSTGKWARNKQIRAKYDKESRQALTQQLTISRELTQKIKSNQDESEEENDDSIEDISIKNDESNPWVSEIKPHKDVMDFVSGYRKYWLEKNKNHDTREENGEDAKENQEEKVIHENTKINLNNENEESQKSGINIKQRKQINKEKEIKTNLNELKSTSDWEVKVVNDVSTVNMFNKLENIIEKKMLKNVKRLKKQLKDKTPIAKQKNKTDEKKTINLNLPPLKKTPFVDEELIIDSENTEQSKYLNELKTILNSETDKNESNIDPNKYLNVKVTNLTSICPDILTTNENEEEKTQHTIIKEAFENDDIVQDFNKEKKDEIEKDKPKNIDLSLPGWGSWGGANIKVSKRKRRLFRVRIPEKVPRRDDNKGSLIINENSQKKIKEHMVSDVPFPFKTVKDFEASIRAPISNTWVPETAYRKNIKPAVCTKMGTIIEPISKEILLNKHH